MAWWAAQSKDGPSDALETLLPHVRWPLLAIETLSHVESRHEALRGNTRLCELLLEGFRFASADARGKAHMRQQGVRCRPRQGMLVLGPLLPEGPILPDAPSSSLPLALSFVWNVSHFASLSCLSMYSPGFSINGHTWKIYVYPKGNNNKGAQLSIYLDSGITDAHEQLHCTFKLAVINYKLESPGDGGGINAQETVVKESVHTFCKRAKDWGFREFMPLERLEDPQAGFINEGTITLGVFIELT